MFEFLSKVFKVATLTLLLFSLSGCGALFGQEGWFRDREDDYRKAEEIPKITVPEHLDDSTLAELFVIPPISNEYLDADEEFVVPQPSTNYLSKDNEVKVQQLGDRHWLVVSETPSIVWPRVRNFLESSGIAISKSDPANGELETSWLRLKGEETTKDRYLFRIEQGVQIETTEIHIVQITKGLSASAKSIIWPKYSNDLEREIWMRDKLSANLSRSEASSVSLLAQAIGNDRKVELVVPYKKDPFIVMSLDFARAWASVAGGLQQNGFAVLDKNRTAGLYFVSYIPVEITEEAEKKPGWFRRFFSFIFRFGRDKEEEAVPVISHQVLLKQHNNEVRVFIKDAEGADLPITEAQKLLHIIRNSLI